MLSLTVYTFRITISRGMQWCWKMKVSSVSEKHVMFLCCATWFWIKKRNVRVLVSTPKAWADLIQGNNCLGSSHRLSQQVTSKMGQLGGAKGRLPGQHSDRDSHPSTSSLLYSCRPVVFWFHPLFSQLPTDYILPTCLPHTLSATFFPSLHQMQESSFCQGFCNVYSGTGEGAFLADPTPSYLWALVGADSCSKMRLGKASLLHILTKMTITLGFLTGLALSETSILPNAIPKTCTSLLGPFNV